jgi:hypothetical protein
LLDLFTTVWSLGRSTLNIEIIIIDVLVKLTLTFMQSQEMSFENLPKVFIKFIVDFSEHLHASQMLSFVLEAKLVECWEGKYLL